jgi:hypothetical protein
VELVESEMEVPAQYNITASCGINHYSCLQYKGCQCENFQLYSVFLIKVTVRGGFK